MAKKELTNARETAQAIKPGRFAVKLRSVGNPDHRQYAPVSEPVTVFVNSLREASEECRKYISEWDLGSGNWPDTFVLESGVKVARISYNGRVWDLGGNEIDLANDEAIGRKFTAYQREMGPKLDASLHSLLRAGLEPGESCAAPELAAELAPLPVKMCPRCEESEISLNAAICSGCEEEIAEDAPPDGAWVNTPHGMVYE